jgi:hypothetical protein
VKRILLTSIALSTIAFQSAYAEELKIHVFMHGVDIQRQLIGDKDGHSLALTKFAGLGRTSDGTICKVAFTSIAEGYAEGGNIDKMYYGVTSDDGTLWIGGTADILRKGEKNYFSGPITIISGTGKYANAKGEGTMTGIRVSPLVTGVAELYNELTINLHK